MAVKKRKEPATSHNPLAERILGQRAAADVEISLERLEAELVDASRYDIVASLKELEKAGEGQFIAGRKGQRSRFVWGAKAGGSASRKASAAAAPEPRDVSKRASKRVAKVASKAAPSASRRAAEKPPSADPGESAARELLAPGGGRLTRTKLSREAGAPVSRIARSLQHSFHLRPGLTVSIDLPEDVTPTEVDRFCTFLKALPFAGPRR